MYLSINILLILSKSTIKKHENLVYWVWNIFYYYLLLNKSIEPLCARVWTEVPSYLIIVALIYVVFT